MLIISMLILCLGMARNLHFDIVGRLPNGGPSGAVFCRPGVDIRSIEAPAQIVETHRIVRATTTGDIGLDVTMHASSGGTTGDFRSGSH